MLGIGTSLEPGWARTRRVAPALAGRGDHPTFNDGLHGRTPRRRALSTQCLAIVLPWVYIYWATFESGYWTASGIGSVMIGGRERWLSESAKSAKSGRRWRRTGHMPSLALYPLAATPLPLHDRDHRAIWERDARGPSRISPDVVCMSEILNHPRLSPTAHVKGCSVLARRRAVRPMASSYCSTV